MVSFVWTERSFESSIRMMLMENIKFTWKIRISIKIQGEGLRAVEDVLKTPGSLRQTVRTMAVISACSRISYSVVSYL